MVNIPSGRFGYAYAAKLQSGRRPGVVVRRVGSSSRFMSALWVRSASLGHGAIRRTSSSPALPSENTVEGWHLVERVAGETEDECSRDGVRAPAEIRLERGRVAGTLPCFSLP